MRRRPLRRPLLIAAAALAVTTPIAAQQFRDETPGPNLRLDLTTGVRVTDNEARVADPPDGTSTLSETRLGLTFDTRTRTQRLTARAGGVFEFGAYADEELADPGFQSPFLALDYGLRRKNAELSFDARYSEFDVGSERTFDLDGEDLIVDRGTRANTRIGAAITLGLQGPLRYSAEALFTERTFFDTTDPDLTDLTRFSLDQRLSLALTRSTRLTFDLDYAQTDEADGTDREEISTDYLLGLEHLTTRGLTASARFGLGVEETTRTIDGDRSTDREEEPILTLSVTQALPNGAVSGEFNRRLTAQGLRSNLTFGRSMDLRVGGLEATLGVAELGEDDLTVIGSLTYDRPTPTGVLGLRLSRRVNYTDDTDVERFDAAMNYRHQIDRLSSVALDLGLASSISLDPEEADREQANLRVTYTRQVTRDWDVNVGYAYSSSQSDDDDRVTENAVFANVSRSFDLLR